MGRDYIANPVPVPTGTLAELLFQSVDRFGDRESHRTIDDRGCLHGISYRQVLGRAREIAFGLVAMGLKRGDRVAILARNCPEWSQTDFGAICAGLPLVPIHTSLTASQVAYILRDSGSGVIFVSDSEQQAKATAALRLCPASIPIITFDPGGPTEGGAVGWEAFLESGREAMQGIEEEAFREGALSAAPADVATILYTSGTTGEPKGVVLTHNNLFSNVQAASMVIPVDETDRTLSFLPLSHILQRMVDYLFFSRGSTITYARSMGTIAEDLKISRPTKVVATPRLFEKSYQKVMEQPGVKSLIVRWAREVGEAWADERLAGREPTWVLKLVYGIAHRLVFRRIAEELGGHLDLFVSGGAPLAPEISKFFYSAGILILEGYGLSETSPVTNVLTPWDFQIGSVGPPVPGTEISIAEDGEILVRGPQVMKEYFNRPDETAAAIDADGWLHTGDVGDVDERGHLHVTDRKKDLIVTAGGKNIAPAPIENRIRGNRFVDQVVMIGDRRHFPSLLLVPAFEALEEWARGYGIVIGTRRDLLKDPRVQEHLGSEVFGCLDGLASYERPKKIGLIAEAFTIENGTLTPNQKVKRRVIRERFGPMIEKLYDPASREKDILVEEN